MARTSSAADGKSPVHSQLHASHILDDWVDCLKIESSVPRCFNLENLRASAGFPGT